ncbi:MAG: YggS family pyridoxal phosphate-dependent enzyme [Desulfobacterales bacterium]|nr:YggS family pyridoxal phosphate-dependent enzyme [Desulfobacterales bacterium]
MQYQQIEQNSTAIKKRIETAAMNCGRNPDHIKLIAVTKTVTPDRIENAIQAGLNNFGENYIQEAIHKIQMVIHQDIFWHYIGHLQTNKAKIAVSHFHLIHSVDSVKLARALNQYASQLNKIQSILLQVNISDEQSKSGFSMNQVESAIHDILQFPHVKIQGLMTMPPYFDDPEHARPFLKNLRQLRDHLLHELPQVCLDELSMGMSSDFEVAIEEGATMLRIGTAIFGERE